MLFMKLSVLCFSSVSSIPLLFYICFMYSYIILYHLSNLSYVILRYG